MTVSKPKEKSIIRQARAILKEREALLARLSCPTSFSEDRKIGKELTIRLIAMNLKTRKRR